MVKTTLKILLLSLMLISISCKKEQEVKLTPDYKVVEIDYGFSNYIKNLRDNSEMLTIKQRNFVLIEVDKNGSVSIKKEVVEDSLIVSELKKYIVPSPEDKKMPSTKEDEFEFAGKVIYNNKLIILAHYDKALRYEQYNAIRNKVYAAYTSVRNEFAVTKFGKTLKELIHSGESDDAIKYGEIRQIFPIGYYENIKND